MPQQRLADLGNQPGAGQLRGMQIERQLQRLALPVEAGEQFQPLFEHLGKQLIDQIVGQYRREKIPWPQQPAPRMLPARQRLAQARVEPIYITLEGWKESTVGARKWADLPAQAIKYVRQVEELIGAPVALLSTSPERDDTILVTDPFED